MTHHSPPPSQILSGQIAHCQLPVANCKLPIAHYPSERQSKKSILAGHSSGQFITHHSSLTTSFSHSVGANCPLQLPIANCLSPITRPNASPKNLIWQGIHPGNSSRITHHSPLTTSFPNSDGANCPLPIAHCPLPIAHCLSPIHKTPSPRKKSNMILSTSDILSLSKYVSHFISAISAAALRVPV